MINSVKVEAAGAAAPGTVKTGTAPDAGDPEFSLLVSRMMTGIPFMQLAAPAAAPVTPPPERREVAPPRVDRGPVQGEGPVPPATGTAPERAQPGDARPSSPLQEDSPADPQPSPKTVVPESPKGEGKPRTEPDARPAKPAEALPALVSPAPPAPTASGPAPEAVALKVLPSEGAGPIRLEPAPQALQGTPSAPAPGPAALRALPQAEEKQAIPTAPAGTPAIQPPPAAEAPTVIVAAQTAPQTPPAEAGLRHQVLAEARAQAAPAQQVSAPVSTDTPREGRQGTDARPGPDPTPVSPSVAPAPQPQVTTPTAAPDPTPSAAKVEAAPAPARVEPPPAPIRVDPPTVKAPEALAAVNVPGATAPVFQAAPKVEVRAAPLAVALETAQPLLPPGSASAAPSVARASAPTAPAPAKPSPVFSQVEGSIRWILKQGSQGAELQLHPESLGKVTIKLTMEGNQVHAQVWASEARTLPILQDHRAFLEVSLQQQGLALGSFELQYGQRGQDAALAAPVFSSPAGPAALPEPLQEMPNPVAEVGSGAHRIEVYA
jgi:hypothetical protein